MKAFIFYFMFLFSAMAFENVKFTLKNNQLIMDNCLLPNPETFETFTYHEQVYWEFYFSFKIPMEMRGIEEDEYYISKDVVNFFKRIAKCPVDKGDN